MAQTSFLDSIKKSFADVPIDTANDNAIATTEFLEASESLSSLFGRYTPFLTRPYRLTGIKTPWAPLLSHR